MKKATYKIEDRCGAFHNVTGYATKHFGVHKTPKGWSLTHLATRGRVRICPTKRCAATIADALETQLTPEALAAKDHTTFVNATLAIQDLWPWMKAAATTRAPKPF